MPHDSSRSLSCLCSRSVERRTLALRNARRVAASGRPANGRPAVGRAKHLRLRKERHLSFRRKERYRSFRREGPKGRNRKERCSCRLNDPQSTQPCVDQHLAPTRGAVASPLRARARCSQAAAQHPHSQAPLCQCALRLCLSYIASHWVERGMHSGRYLYRPGGPPPRTHWVLSPPMAVSRSALRAIRVP